MTRSLLSAAGEKLRGALSSYVRFAVRRYWVVLGLVGVLSVVCGALGFGVGLDSRLQALLPDETPSAAANVELKRRLRSSSPLYLLVEAETLELSRRAAQAMHRRIVKWPETRWAMYKRDPSYFLDHRLLYLAAADLEELNEQIDERHRWEECERIPGCQNIDDEVPPLPGDAELQRLFDKDPDVRALASLFGDDASSFTTSRPAAKTKTAPVAGAAPPSAASGNTAAEGELGELCDAERKTCTVQVAIEGDAGDLVYAAQILKRAEAIFAEVRTELNAPKLNMAVSGPYRNASKTQQAVSRDLQKTTLLSALLVLLVVLLQFRGARSVVVLLLPAALGIVWTLGPLGAFGVKLNLISAFTLAVLAGVGIDFGVHMLTHFSQIRGRGVATEEALLVTFRELSPSLLVAAATTSSGFLALTAASFRGFSEMGPIAAGGVITSLIAFLVVFPPLVALMDNPKKLPFLLRTYSFSPWAWLRAKALPLASLGIVLSLALAALGAGVVGSGVDFEYNFRKLRPQGVGHGIRWSRTMHGTARTAVYLMADDQQALTDFAAALRADRPLDVAPGDKPFLVVPGAFIPPDQKARLAAITELKTTLESAEKRAKKDLKAKIDDFMPLVQVKDAIELEPMPAWVQDWLVESDGRFGTLGVLYTRFSGSDARQMERLVGHLDAWRPRFPKIRFASPVAQLGEVTPRLRSEAPLIVLLALLGVGLGTLLVGRSVRRSLTVFLPLAITMAISVGLMALFEVRVNLYNMLVFPLAFGIGVDGAVYVAWALSDKQPEKKLPTAARAVLGSTLTSVAAFGSLMVSSNPGLYSIGLLATLMLLVSLVANLLWLPAASWAAGGLQKARGKS